MRVALFTDADVFAGTERHILDLAVALRDQAIDVSIACPQPSPLAERADANHIQVIAIQKTGLIDRPAIRTLRNLLSSGKLDLIHSHNGRTALSAAIAVRASRAGHCVMTQHFVHPSHSTRRGIKGLLSNLAHKWMNRRTDHFIAISQAVHSAMIDRHEAEASKISVVTNGIPDPSTTALTPPQSLRRELGIDPQAPLIVCAARLEAEKDVSTLIAAMSTVLAAHPSARCLIAGEGSQHQSLQQQIDAANLQSAVRLLGFRPDALALINAADIFVLPSLAEPFGLVILEAMALSKPVIATRAGGPLEIVQDSRTGLLIPVSSPTILAQAITRLIADPSLGQSMGRAGRELFLQQFTAPRMAADIAQIYRRILQGSPQT